MTNIYTIPIPELLSDLEETNRDIALCESVLSNGVLGYSGGKVSERLAINRQIQMKILVELERRDVHILEMKND